MCPKVCSISSDGLASSLDTGRRDFDNLDVVTGVDVSLSDRVDDILGASLYIGSVLREFHLHVIVTDELVVEERRTHLGARALHTISQRAVRADGIIAVDDTLVVSRETAEQVERIVRHEATAVQGVHEQLSEGLSVRVSVVVLSAIDLDLGDEQLVQRINIGDHATGRDDALGSQLRGAREGTRNDRVALRDSRVGSDQAEVLAGDSYKQMMLNVRRRLRRKFG